MIKGRYHGGFQMNNNVMIVDDEANTRDLIVKNLSRYGLNVVAAGCGEQCLEHFKNGFGGVVLMDVRMPGMDGWKTIKQIVKLGYVDKAVIILLTADKGTRSDNYEDFKKYVAEYMPKPVDLKQLFITVKNYLRYL
jgi:DNA-binding NtrC family response regulator